MKNLELATETAFELMLKGCYEKADGIIVGAYFTAEYSDKNCFWFDEMKEVLWSLQRR